MCKEVDEASDTPKNKGKKGKKNPETKQQPARPKPHVVNKDQPAPANTQQRSAPQQSKQAVSAANNQEQEHETEQGGAESQYAISGTPLQFSYPEGQPILHYKNVSESRDDDLSTENLSSYSYSHTK